MCDSTGGWIVLGSKRAQQAADDWSIIKINVHGLCEEKVITGMAYLWSDTPTKRMTGLPIYTNDTFRLPGPPWTIQLELFD